MGAMRYIGLVVLVLVCAECTDASEYLLSVHDRNIEYEYSLTIKIKLLLYLTKL